MINDIGAVRQGIANILTAGFPDWQVSGYFIASPTPPTLYVIYPARGVNFHLSMGGAIGRANFTIRALVPASGDIGMQMQLDHMVALTGPYSLHEAFDQNSTLDGIISGYAHIEEVTEPRLIVPASGGPYLGVDFMLTVVA